MKIEKLTPTQIARFPEFVEKWTQIGLATEAADRPQAETAIREMYKIARLAAPKIVWCGSPLAQGLTRAIILDEKLLGDIGRSVRDSVRGSVWASVRDSVGASVRANVGASVWASVGDSVWASVGAGVLASVVGGVRASVRDNVGDSVGASVRDSVGASVRASVGDSVWDGVGGGVWAGVRASVGDSVLTSVWANVGASVRDSVWASVRGSVWDGVLDSVWANVWASVRASVRDSVWASVRDSVGASVYGQHDASWLGFYDFFADVLALKNETAKLSGLMALSHSAGWALPHKNICWISERHHILARDSRGRLHSIVGPACAFPDGWAIYAVHGIRVPAYVVERPQEITVAKIASETNIEVRRVMIERYGEARYIVDSGMYPVASDDSFGDLYVQRGPGRPIAIIGVANRTAEPDGSFKRYMIPVNPDLYGGDAGRIPQAAVASTWRTTKGGKDLVFKDWHDYRPIYET